MAQPASVVCPACQSRNKAAWDYCARCGESLAGAAAPAPTVRASEAKRATARSKKHSATPLVLIVVGILGVTGAAAWWLIPKQAAAGKVDPGIFGALGSNQATPPPSSAGPPAASAVTLERARSLVAAGDLKGAIALLREALAADQGNADFHAALANVLLSSGDAAGSLLELEAASRISPEKFLLSYARNLNSSGRPAEAQQVYEQILERGGGNPTEKEEYGRLLYQNKNYARAAEMLTEAVRVRGDDPLLRQELAVSLELSGNKARAMDEYQRIVSRNPDATAARERLALLMVGDSRLDEAERVLRDGIAASPEAPLLRRGLGAVLEQAGRSDEAAREYREYLKLLPDAGDAADIRARIAKGSGGGAS